MLTGWGRTAPTMAEVYQPRSHDDVAALLAAADDRGAVARGLGRAYGDAAQNGGGEVLDMTAMATVSAIDLELGLVVAEGGVSLDRLMRSLVPLGWFVPVTAGTRHVTVGGAIAADIHGKNHHRDGSFCSHVASLTLQTNGNTVVAGPDTHPDVFWATAGGMGLTGVVTDAVVRMLPIRTSMIRQDTERADNLDEAMALMESGDDQYRYSVAWVDYVARGKAPRTLGADPRRPRDARRPPRRQARRRPLPSSREPRSRLPPGCPRAWSARSPSAPSTSSTSVARRAMSRVA